MLRRRRSQDESPATRPPWRERFDEAAAMIRSRPQPAWIDQRIDDMASALTAAQTDIDNLSETIDRLDAPGTAAELKRALRDSQRQVPTSSVGDDRRVVALRRRYDAVNDLLNQRHEIAQRIADAIADLELLAVEALHGGTSTAGESDSLDRHVERLEIDLRALSAARREVEGL